ncbi:MAG TPA: DUF6526 family protein [Candidatus Acidoferrales bacterium]|nr:DUF6526 family protein [Candidatus Acidoferrales bacterium]
MSETQNFENHAKIVPAFHFFVLPVFALNLVSSILRCVRFFSFDSVVTVLLALAFVVGALCARIFALTVQDRVIRLEMRLRMQQVLPVELRGRIPEFTVSQLVALRFAGDAELPGLARKVLDEKLTDRKSIKKMIQKWEPDYLRA